MSLTITVTHDELLQDSVGQELVVRVPREVELLAYSTISYHRGVYTF